jgi:hypothetical protein
VEGGLTGRLVRLAPPPWLAVGAAVTFGVIGCRPIGDVDIYWQVKLGDVMLAAGTPFITEPFLAHRAGLAHEPICWLSQVILALVRRAGDWQAVRVFDALLLTGGFLAICWPAALRLRDWPRGWVALLAGGAGLFCIAPYTTVRPQTFTVFAWGLLLAVYFANLRPGPKILSAALVCLFWQNCHPSIGVAAVFLGTAAGAGWVRYLRKRRAGPPWVETAIVFVAAVSQLATPAGFAIFPIAQMNRHMCTDIFPISEWLPITDPRNLPRSFAELRNQPGSLHGLGIAAATAALVAWRRRRVRWEEVMPAAAAFAACFYASRFTLLLAPAVVPIWVRCLTPPGAERSPDNAPISATLGRIRWAIFLGLMAVAAAVPFVLRPKLDAAYPFPYAGIEALKKRHVSGTIYVYYLWGGIVSDLGYPQWKVSHDGRYYLHTDRDWYDYFDDDMDAFEAFHPVGVILDQNYDKKMIQKLRKNPEYEQIHEDKLAATFVRR